MKVLIILALISSFLLTSCNTDASEPKRSLHEIILGKWHIDKKEKSVINFGVRKYALEVDGITGDIDYYKIEDDTLLIQIDGAVSKVKVSSFSDKQLKIIDEGKVVYWDRVMDEMD